MNYKKRHLREQELSSRIHAKHTVGSLEYADKLKNLKKGEVSRKSWQTMKFLRDQSGTVQQMNRLDIPRTWPEPQDHELHITDLEDPKSCQDWKTITDPDEIEFYIRLRNRGHFGQAQGTPFTELPLSNDINWSANTPESDAILAGHYQTDNIDSIPQCKALLRTCQAASDLDLLPYHITETEFAGKLKSWRETTTHPFLCDERLRP